MRPTSSTVLALLAAAGVACVGFVAAAQPASAAEGRREIPQSLVLEHQETLAHLSVLAQRPGPVGARAREAMALFERHAAREEAYILPPLTLLPDLADGKVTPDMAWAMAMTDRVKAEREQIFQEHTEMTAVLNALLAAGERANDHDAVEFARAAATDSLNDLELLEPTVEVIGEVLHAKLPAVGQ
ncbi:MAG: hypothetical protein P4L73_07665 [Caulobacteraceae bacterium]|nr:hypothetical protein [Caulobacteraceae bacterium]